MSKKTKLLSTVLWLFLVLVVSGCAQVQLKYLYPLLHEKEPSPLHYIIADKEGHPLDRDGEGLKTNKFQEHYLDPILFGIDEHVNRIRQYNIANQTNKPARLLIFIHGGLNPYMSGLDRVAMQVPDGKLGDSEFYPLYVVWNSSLLSSVWDDLVTIRGGMENPWLGAATAPFRFLLRIGGGIVGAPGDLYDMIVNAGDSFGTGKKGETRVDLALIGTRYVVLSPIRFLSVPFIRSFGTPAWEMMKRRADLLVARRLVSNDYSDEGAAWLLFDRMKERLVQTKDGQTEWITADGNRAEIAITLVGHSMGTIVADRILQEFPTILFHRILYLGSASSIADYEIFVRPYLRMHERADFRSFVLSIQDEAREFNVCDLAERGSLLHWIDTFFEDIATPRDRRFGRYKNYEKFYIRRKVNIHPDLQYIQFHGLDGEPTEHGQFDDLKYLQKILLKVDSEAFPVSENE